MPWDLVARDYAEVTTPFFENYAAAALDRTMVGSNSRVLDVACGPGTLTLLAARRGCHVTALDFAASMIHQLRTRAAQSAAVVEVLVADGQSLPLDDSRFDAAFSMFGLMFFPNRVQGLRELHRVLVPGGVAAISSWQPMDRFPMLGDVFAALRELLPNMPFGQGKAPLGEPREIIEEMNAAGFESVLVEEVSASIEAPTLTVAWDHLNRGSAPFALLRRNIGDAAWLEVERGILESVRKKYGSGPQTLTMTANLGIGRKPINL